MHGLIILIFTLSFSGQVFQTEPLTQLVLSDASVNQVAKIRNYYVSQTGSDNNPGTSLLPFLNIQRAADIADPGDTVVVRNGVYTTTGSSLVTITKSGRPNGYIIFRSEHKWGAVLDGKNVSGYGFMLGHGASYVTFIDFELKNFLYMGYFCNDALHQSNYITIQGNNIHDIGRVQDTEPYGKCGVYLRMKNNHWTIDKNLMYNIGRTGPDSYLMNKDHAVYTGRADIGSNVAHHINITNNLIFGVSGNALNLCSNNDLIANNVFAWSNENGRGGSNFITMDGPGVSDETIVNNIFYQPPSSNAFVLLSYSGYSGWSVKNNMVYGGRMWYETSPETKAAMKGGNYGRSDCEKAEVNPRFVSANRENAPQVDFRLHAKSPAINAGIDVGLTSDYEGHPITGVPDIGAYKYRSPNLSPAGN